ncbi:MAG: sigma-54-dependent Fis family transcriptional regulator [Fibrobacteres bacterium]|nr:sigma-54-dependent Fis family transcriptional regulator [Fibrobacterota bacterium]
MAKILIIDDEINIRKSLSEIMSDESHECITAATGNEGLSSFSEFRPDVVLLDVRLPDTDGIEVLKKIKASGLDVEVIMISGHATIESAVKAVKIGAYHFIQKPLSLIEVKQSVRHAAEAKKQRDALLILRHSEDERYKMVGESPALLKLKEQLSRVAPTNGRVMINGESGTGKELAAYAIHRESKRANAPFIKVNCAAIPQNLIESELFGHEKGAFTGAIAMRTGCFELADCGTLFLDEIGDMDLSTQARVLRVLQEGEFTRVGGTKTIKVDVRVIAATHRNLEEMVSSGAFREDLYFRLNVVPIRMPSLSDRASDIPLLANHFLERYAIESGSVKKQLSPEARIFLTGEPFRGNIRELKNRIERAAILCPGTAIEVSYLNGEAFSLRADVASPKGSSTLFTTTRPLSEAKDMLEAEFVKTQLEINNWDIPETAEKLGIARTNLHRKIKQLGITKA